MDKLTKEEVMHVLNLAKLDATNEEIEAYQVELKKMIDEIDKIKEISDSKDELLIAPWLSDANLRSINTNSYENEDLFLNVPNKKGNFIEVNVEVLKNE